MNGKILFSVTNPYYVAADEGLWVTDGTEEGTILLDAGINTALFSTAVMENILYFGALVLESGKYELFRSDGTVSGTYSINPDNLQVAQSFAVFNDKLFFYGNDQLYHVIPIVKSN